MLARQGVRVRSLVGVGVGALRSHMSEQCGQKGFLKKKERGYYRENKGRKTRQRKVREKF